MTETVLFTSVHIYRYGGGSVSYGSQAVVRDGVVGWLVGGTDFRPLMRDVAAKHGVEWTPKQQTGYTRYVTRTLGAYREARANMTDEQRAEEAYEMRAAFGPGETVVDIFTGERFYTGD